MSKSAPNDKLESKSSETQVARPTSRSTLNILSVILIVLQLAMALALGVFLTIAIKNDFSFGFLSGNATTEIAVDKSYPTDFKTLTIAAAAGDISISHATDGNTHVLIYADEKDGAIAERKGDELNLSVEGTSCLGLCFSNALPKIEVLLPADYASEIEIKSDFGSIALGDFKYANLKIESSFGDIKIGSINTLELDHDFGSLSVGTLFSHAEIKNNFGTVEIDDIKLQNKSLPSEFFCDKILSV